jgi:hypothetical protein
LSVMSGTGTAGCWLRKICSSSAEHGMGVSMVDRRQGRREKSSCALKEGEIVQKFLWSAWNQRVIKRQVRVWDWHGLRLASACWVMTGSQYMQSIAFQDAPIFHEGTL